MNSCVEALNIDKSVPMSINRIKWASFQTVISDMNDRMKHSDQSHREALDYRQPNLVIAINISPSAKIFRTLYLNACIIH